MKCDKCGFVPNPGDQVCINCGAKLSLANAIMPEVENVPLEFEKKNNRKFIIFLIIGLVILIAIIFFTIMFFLKR